MSKNRGIYRCGVCRELGHTAKKHPRRRKRPPAYSSINGAYASNRQAGLCDDCGSPSGKRARCPRCARNRNERPSRRPGYRKAVRL
jgi:hypothetical protein